MSALAYGSMLITWSTSRANVAMPVFLAAADTRPRWTSVGQLCQGPPRSYSCSTRMGHRTFCQNSHPGAGSDTPPAWAGSRPCPSLRLRPLPQRPLCLAPAPALCFSAVPSEHGMLAMSRDTRVPVLARAGRGEARSLSARRGPEAKLVQAVRRSGRVEGMRTLLQRTAPHYRDLPSWPPPRDVSIVALPGCPQ
jgi:hypothetical protein